MSRFDDLLKNAKGKPAAPPSNPGAKTPAKMGSATPEPEATPLPSPAPPRGPGRPKGDSKKENAAYRQVTAYVPREAYEEVRSILWKEHGGKQFSQLIEELLAAWLERQHSG